MSKRVYKYNRDRGHQLVSNGESWPTLTDAERKRALEADKRWSASGQDIVEAAREAVRLDEEDLSTLIMTREV